MRTSDYLTIGDLYTRKHLANRFAITDATLNNGVFRPQGHKSIWLFITETKTKDRPQLIDRYDADGGVLYFQGQPLGRTDPLLINHKNSGAEVLLFHRMRKNQHSDYAFRYEGPFEYASHSGERPTSFVFRRVMEAGRPVTLEDETERVISEESAFDPSQITDTRKKQVRTVVQRRGQQRFRQNLLAAYGHQCAVTGCRVETVLEAAHIVPHRGQETDVVCNGLLLRADIHTLFDLGLIAISPHDYTIHISGALRGSEYGNLHGKPLRLPADPSHAPSKEALTLLAETYKQR